MHKSNQRFGSCYTPLSINAIIQQGTDDKSWCLAFSFLRKINWSPSYRLFASISRADRTCQRSRWTGFARRWQVRSSPLCGNQGAAAFFCRPCSQKDTTALTSISCANLDNRGRCLYNNVVESLSTQKLNIEMFKHILWESVSSDRVSVHRKCRTAPPRLWFCWREL